MRAPTGMPMEIPETEFDEELTPFEVDMVTRLILALSVLHAKTEEEE